jgi:Uma2 family endonuclease
MISLTRNDYEPDIVFFAAAKASGFKSDQHRFPAPDLVVEVLSPSTEAADRGLKLEDYAAHGIMEYWIVDAAAQRVEQYVLSEGEYKLKSRSASGELKSRALPGLKIPVRAVFDQAENLRALQAILRAPRA